MVWVALPSVLGFGFGFGVLGVRPSLHISAGVVMVSNMVSF